MRLHLAPTLVLKRHSFGLNTLTPLAPCDAGVPDGIAGKWDVPMCVKNGGFLIPGHALFMWHQAWLAMVMVTH